MREKRPDFSRQTVSSAFRDLVRRVDLPRAARIGAGFWYTGAMRRRSSLDDAKRRDRIERARRMTPEQRLQACVNLSKLTAELRLAGERDRARGSGS